MSERLEEQSFNNLINFYENELSRIMQGERATSCLSIYNRRHFVKNGVLKMRGNALSLSDRAKKVLEAQKHE